MRIYGNMLAYVEESGMGGRCAAQAGHAEGRRGSLIGRTTYGFRSGAHPADAVGVSIGVSF